MMHNQATRRTTAMAREGTEQSAVAQRGEGDKRVHERHAVELEIEIDSASDHNFYAGITLDLSEGGVFVATHLERAIGTRVELALRLPGSSEPLRCAGEVRWTRAYNESSDAPPGLGIRFVAVEPVVQEAIQRFLAERAPMFYDD
jgi:uncharacterized protein (TIGR02266 family)